MATTEAPAATLLVSEVFGPTLQGEGPGAGRPCAFVRLGGCNLACSWCDTPYTWDHRRYDLRAELTEQPVSALIAAVAAMGVRRLVVTGGEPLLQAQRLAPLLCWAHEHGYFTEVETNGTRFPPALVLAQVQQWNVSPKLRHSGNADARRLDWAVLHGWAEAPWALFKFVVQRPDDLSEVDALVQRLHLAPGRVWIMPEGTTAAAQRAGLQALATPTLARGYNLGQRLHIHIWGNERGR